MPKIVSLMYKDGNSSEAIFIEGSCLDELFGEEADKAVKLIVDFFEQRGMFLGRPWQIQLEIDKVSAPQRYENGRRFVTNGKTSKVNANRTRAHVKLYANNIFSFGHLVEVLFHELEHVADIFEHNGNPPTFEHIEYRDRPHEIRARETGERYRQVFAQGIPVA